MRDGLLLLHLSDIHFKKGNVGGIHDLDADLRNELERDCAEFRRKLGDVSAILVTGDIAFAGKPEEFKAAKEWLTQLCLKVGCREENILTTPGNHDVDRDAAKPGGLVAALHETLRSRPLGELDDQLRRSLEDPAAAAVLLGTVTNYNEFAAPFGCEVTRDRVFWERDLPLNDGSVLRVRGLNSALISSAKDDEGAKLILGAAQTTLTRHEGVEYMTLCHHPPQFLADHDVVDEALLARARVQLFGHKHSFRMDTINESIRIAAGAMHPDRRETGWKPKFNLLRLSVSGDGTKRHLNVDVWSRSWRDTQREFIADHEKDGSDHRTFSLKIGDWTPPARVVTRPVAIESVDIPHAPIASQSTPVDLPALIAAAGSRASVEREEDGLQMEPARRLTYRFLTLPYHTRLAIAQKLELLNDEDKGVPDGELFRRFFRRAREKRQLGTLWTQVEQHHGAKDLAPNPFANQ